MTNEKNMTMETVSTSRVPQRVSGFDPMQFAKEVVNKAGEKVLTLELKHKKNWFRLACPNGGVVLNPLRVTDQMAIFEARLFADTDDRNPLASFTATRSADKATGGQYIRAAQEDALNEALENAGFSLQLHKAFQARQTEPVQKVSVADVQKEEAPPMAPPDQGSEAEQAAPDQGNKTEQAAIGQVAVKTAPVTVQATQQTKPIPGAVAKPTVTNPPSQASEQRPTPAAPQPRKTERVTQEKKETVAAVVDISAGRAKDTTHQPNAQEDNTQMSLDTEPTPASYNADMTVDEICKVMTLEQAKAIKVPEGTCRGWTLEQVARDRPSSLKWLLYACTFADNVLKAAAKLVLADLELKMAG